MPKEKHLFRVVRCMLIISGIWPLGIDSKYQFWLILFKVYRIMALLIYLTSPFAFGGAMIEHFLKNSVGKALEDFSRMIFVILIILKLNIIRSKKIKNIINLVTNEELKIMENPDKVKREIYQFHVCYCKKMVFSIVIFLYAAGLINMFNGLFELYKWETMEDIKNRTTIKPQIIPLWFPFNKDKHFIISIVYQIWHIFQTLSINGAIQALINSVMVFIRANLKVLQYDIRNFDGGSLKPLDMVQLGVYAECSLKKLIIRHQQLIGWLRDLDASFKNILLLEYSITSLQLATTLIQIVELENVPFNASFFTHCLLQLLGLAWNANEILLESSNGLLQALYDSNWYNKDKNVGYLIRFMMIRCSRPLVMNIGPLGIMNLNAAVSRVKLAYTVLSVLKVTTADGKK